MKVYKLLTGYSSFVEMCSTSCLLCLDDFKIVIDTGAKENREALLKRLKELEIKPEEIDIVLNTHLHMDHCWNNELFSNAFHYCSEKEYRTLLDVVRLVNSDSVKIDEIISLLLFLTPAETPGLLRKLVLKFLYEDGVFEKMLLPKRVNESLIKDAGLQVVETPGHTDGHVSFIYKKPGKELPFVFLGDSIIHMGQYGKQQVKVLFTKNIRQYWTSKGKIEQHVGVYFPGHGHEFRVNSLANEKAVQFIF